MLQITSQRLFLVGQLALLLRDVEVGFDLSCHEKLLPDAAHVSVLERFSCQPELCSRGPSMHQHWRQGKPRAPGTPNDLVEPIQTSPEPFKPEWRLSPCGTLQLQQERGVVLAFGRQGTQMMLREGFEPRDNGESTVNAFECRPPPLVAPGVQSSMKVELLHL